MADVEDIVNHLKTELDAEGIPLLNDIKPTHHNIMVTCPVHKDGQETKPSMGILTVDTERGHKVYKAGTANCFTCGAVLDLPQLVSHCLGYNDGGQFGFKWLMKRFVSIEVEERPDLSLDMDRKNSKKSLKNLLGQGGISPVDGEYYIVDEEELDRYRWTHPYMYERKLTDKVINYFDVGYDRVKQALTFPVRDKEGKTRLIQRRSVQGKMFINDEGGNKGDWLYGLYEVWKNIDRIDELIIAESPIDALTCWANGVYAVATMGALITERQAQLINDMPIRVVVLGQDNPIIDEAGWKARRKCKKMLKGKILFDLIFPDEVKDINAMSTEQFKNRQTELLTYDLLRKYEKHHPNEG